MTTLLVSDLHLSPARPGRVRDFHALLQGPARGAVALYVLGDLFDYWLGDDDLATPFNAGITAAFKSLAESGVGVYFQHGNRDFLLGQAFAEAAGGVLLPEIQVVTLYGRPTLLMHGDQLCTDDVDYHRFRSQVRSPAWQQAFLAQPLAARQAQVGAYRDQSESAKAAKDETIMDVNADAVLAAFRHYNVDRIIHGHTHRPGRHQYNLDGSVAERWVLSDWYEQASYLAVTPDTISARAFP